MSRMRGRSLRVLTGALAAIGLAQLPACGRSYLEIPVGGGTPVTLVKGGAAGPIAVDDTSVYWGDSNANAVMRLTPK